MATSSLTRSRSDCQPGRLEVRRCLANARQKYRPDNSGGRSSDGPRRQVREGASQSARLHAFTRLDCCKYWWGKGGREEGRGRKRKASYCFSSLCQTQTRKAQNYPVPRQPLGPTAQATQGQPRRPRTPAPSDRRGEAWSSVHSCPRAAGGGRSVALASASAPARSSIWHGVSPHLRAALAVCASPSAERGPLERHREFFLVLLGTVHIIYVPPNRSVFVFPGGFSGW